MHKDCFKCGGLMHFQDYLTCVSCGYINYSMEKKESKVRAKKTEEKRLVEEQKKINKQVKQEKILEEKGLLKNPTCSNVSSKGGRCKNPVNKVGHKCTIHEKTEVRKSGKKSQCTSVRTNGKRCKMQTNNTSG